MTSPASPDTDVPWFEPPLSWLRAKHGVKWARYGSEMLPAWVADMDFPVAPVIRQALADQLERGDVTYPDWQFGPHPLAEPFAARMSARFGWQPDPHEVRGIADLISGLQILLGLTTEPGDGVVLQDPNYPPFRNTVPAMGRAPIRLPLTFQDGHWRHDFDRLENLADAKVLLLVNPHNPTGAALEREELLRLAEFADRHDLLVICDEIHADLVHDPNQHVPFAGLSPEIASRTVTLTSATKAFNIAGLRAAVAHLGSAAVRRRWDSQPPEMHGVMNVMGVEATRVAWEQGDDWLAGVRAHLLQQRGRLAAAVAEMPGVSLRLPDATYLAWLDCSGAELGEDAGQFFRRVAKVRMSPGPDFGGGPEMVRCNFATSTEVLDLITTQIRKALIGSGSVIRR
ncbi:MalY/PatB family protein [Kineosporia babensis]|uniref:Aminotransferase n=1 Tax=Kineosporia babensis TaxID=499548 RepID=A0A9X1NG94_9ACTN|nr:aminotransferase class I/II-fold pyridoxal phosphate-dependent enzyme [Kineosporia babensis]MCD5313349.1 aminotransferase class I/II-fold pyridoxal phosphate-dependent enzyme [Kineosporia babensis]